MGDDESVPVENKVLDSLQQYLDDSLPLDENFIINLQNAGLIDKDTAAKLRALARNGDRSCIRDLITHMQFFWNETALVKFCTFLDKFGKDDRPRMVEVAAKIREKLKALGSPPSQATLPSQLAPPTQPTLPSLYQHREVRDKRDFGGEMNEPGPSGSKRSQLHSDDQYSQSKRPYSTTKDHEAALLDNCWIPFGIRTVQIQQSGGTYCLEPLTSQFADDTDEQRDDKNEIDRDPQDQNTFMVEVPDGAIKQESLEVRYGIVFAGPFKLPQGYRLASLVLYISFDHTSVTKPIQICIPHWMAQVESLNAQDCPLVIASHEPKDNVEYNFSPMDHRCCTVNAESSTIKLSGRCSLLGQAMKQNLKNQSHYYATAWEKLKASDYTFRIAVVYGVPIWIKILKRYFPQKLWTKSSLHQFNFASDRISVSLQPCSGPGWEAVMDRDVLKQSEVDFSRMYPKEKYMKEAFDEGIYPPSLYARVTQNCEPRRYIKRKQVCLNLSGTDEGTLRFPFNVQEVDDQIETVTTAPRAGMDGKIGRSIDILGVPEYKNGLIGKMPMLGEVLGMGDITDAILKSGDIDDQLLKILKRYIDEKSPTWRDFCTALKKDSSFNKIREKIEADHNNSSIIIL